MAKNLDYFNQCSVSIDFDDDASDGSDGGQPSYLTNLLSPGGALDPATAHENPAALENGARTVAAAPAHEEEQPRHLLTSTVSSPPLRRDATSAVKPRAEAGRNGTSAATATPGRTTAAAHAHTRGRGTACVTSA